MKTKAELLNVVNSHSQEKLNLKQLNSIVLDLVRLHDKDVVKTINLIKKETGLKLTSNKQKLLRLFLLGYPISEFDYLKSYMDKLELNPDESYQTLFNSSSSVDNMVETILSRFNLYFLHSTRDVTHQYLDYVKSNQVDLNQLVYINIQADKCLSAADIEEEIINQYDYLSNYHNLIISFEDGSNTYIDWTMISELAIFMENFKTENNFHPFNKNNQSKRINELTKFVQNHPDIKSNENVLDLIKSFYQGVSYGFRFVDLYISDDGSKKVLVMQKIELEGKPERCPSCFQETTRLNAYQKLLAKSFECQNPACPDRSKSGRGKRFDAFSAKKQVMLDRNNPDDFVPDEVYTALRKDIVAKENLTLENMIQLYTWSGDNVLAINIKGNDFKGRKLKLRTIVPNSEMSTTVPRQYRFSSLPIYQLLNTISELISIEPSPFKPEFKLNQAIMINDNSKHVKQYQQSNDIKITSAITSPPYYNAREYSQWVNLIEYLIDMMINAKVVYDSLENNSTYIYNIGDVVGCDNIFMTTKTSQKRLMLGFYSVMIFNMVGFNVSNNIIWDKGEVQSKRNSSPNHFAGYLNPINCYEHDWVFRKGSPLELNSSRVVEITPVRKINSKGENTYGHTAPFPEKLAELILPFTDENYILDSFLGSGTTVIMATKHGKKSIGIELNKNYFDLSCLRLKK